MDNKNSFHIIYYPETETLHLCHITQDIFDSFNFSNFKIESLLITGDYLDYLVVPDGIKNVYCGSLGLRKISLPDSVKHLNCENNCLLNIILPDNIKYVNLNQNCLKDISFKNEPNKINVLILSKNYLETLNLENLPRTIKLLDLTNNFYLKEEFILLPNCLLRDCHEEGYIFSNIDDLDFL